MMRESDGTTVHYSTNMCTYTHLESKSVAGTRQGLEPHHLIMKEGTHTPETKKTLTHMVTSKGHKNDKKPFLAHVSPSIF